MRILKRRITLFQKTVYRVKKVVTYSRIATPDYLVTLITQRATFKALRSSPHKIRSVSICLTLSFFVCGNTLKLVITRIIFSCVETIQKKMTIG